MNSRETNRRFVILTAIAAFLILFGAKPAAAQDWFKTGTGLGVSKVRVAAPDLPFAAPHPQRSKKPSTMSSGTIWNIRAFSNW